MAKAVKERFVRAVLTFLAALLTFGGPTYVFYILDKKLAFPRLISLLLGLAFFTVGIILFVYLLKGEGKAGAST
jgi:hypothetical protein